MTALVLIAGPGIVADQAVQEGRLIVLFNDTLNTFYLWLYGHMVKDHSYSERKPAAATWATRRLAARVLLYAPSHRQGSTYHGLCYTSRGGLAGTRNSSMGPPWRIDPTTHRTTSESSYHGATVQEGWSCLASCPQRSHTSDPFIYLQERSSTSVWALSISIDSSPHFGVVQSS